MTVDFSFPMTKSPRFSLFRTKFLKYVEKLVLVIDLIVILWR